MPDTKLSMTPELTAYVRSVSLRDSDLLRRPDWHVTQAKLKIVFYPEAKGKRAKTINVELRAPNGSNLRDQT